MTRSTAFIDLLAWLFFIPSAIILGLVLIGTYLNRPKKRPPKPSRRCITCLIEGPTPKTKFTIIVDKWDCQLCIKKESKK